MSVAEMSPLEVVTWLKDTRDTAWHNPAGLLRDGAQAALLHLAGDPLGDREIRVLALDSLVRLTASLEPSRAVVKAGGFELLRKILEPGDGFQSAPPLDEASVGRTLAILCNLVMACDDDGVGSLCDAGIVSIVHAFMAQPVAAEEKGSGDAEEKGAGMVSRDIGLASAGGAPGSRSPSVVKIDPDALLPAAVKLVGNLIASPLFEEAARRAGVFDLAALLCKHIADGDFRGSEAVSTRRFEAGFYLLQHLENATEEPMNAVAFCQSTHFPSFCAFLNTGFIPVARGASLAAPWAKLAQMMALRVLRNLTSNIFSEPEIMRVLVAQEDLLSRVVAISDVVTQSGEYDTKAEPVRSVAADTILQLKCALGHQSAPLLQ